MVKAVLATKIGDWRETLQLTELPALPDVPPPVRGALARSAESLHAMHRRADMTATDPRLTGASWFHRARRAR